MPRIRRDSVDERGVAFVNKAGRRIASMPAEMFGGEGIVAEIEIMRGDLTRILFEATRDHTEYIFGDRIAELTQADDGVKVIFASGAARSFDLVVGADGVHSGVRALAFGPEADYLRHLGAYTAYFTVPDPGDLDNWFLMYNAPGGRANWRPPPNDYEAAFGRYQDAMRAYVADCQKLPPGGVKGFAPQSQAVISLRALSTKMMTAWPLRNILTRQFRKADGITLKDYA